jgi:hypothetical protein
MSLALLARERRLERQRADLVEGRVGDGADERLQAEAPSRTPAVLYEACQEDGLRRLERIGFDTDESEQAGDDRLDLVAQVLLGVGEGALGRVERLQYVQRHARARARGVDDGVVALLERRDLGGTQAPLGEALLPRRRRVQSGGLHVLALAPRGARVDPGLERRGVLAVEQQQQVGEVAFRVDRDHRYALAQQLLEDHDREAGLARAGHAHDQAVGQEVGRLEL